MNSRFLFLRAGFSGLALFAVLTTAANAGEALTSAAFVEKAGQAGMTEVEAGRIALSKADDQAVRDFAQRMVDDHSTAGAELDAAAKTAKVAAPTQPDAEHRAMIDALSSKSGEEFDRAYSRQMADDHAKAVALFQSAANSDELDPALVAFARKVLPTLQAHKAMADTLAAGQVASSAGDSQH